MAIFTKAKAFIKRIPLVRDIGRFFLHLYNQTFGKFAGSENYWRQRYRKGGGSGAGSYGDLALFKAEIINQIINEHQISHIIELGCGDGNQLRLLRCPTYLGFDVSPEAIQLCEQLFSGDPSKSFKLLKEYNNETAPLTLSLDVIYHLVEDNVFNEYMNILFQASESLVLIYSSDRDCQERFQPPHIKHRTFSRWIDQHQPQWKLIRHVPNKWKYNGNDLESSFADFFLYQKDL